MHTPSRAAGTTLVEALVALVITTTSILAGLQLSTSLAKAHTTVGLKDLALRLLAQELEFVRATDYADLVDTEFIPAGDDDRFEVRWRVSTVLTTKVITITIRYSEQVEVEHSVTTAVCDRGS